MNNPRDATLGELNVCGCCAGTTTQTPAPTANRPGLPEIAFRAGVHATFKASLLAGLSAASRPALRHLRTRADEDFTIGLLDAFAGMADVLTFYSERIANEAFLRTATERRSVLELARAIGYELGPGLAAHVLLAFTIEGGRGAPGTAIIPKGTKIQSVPGPEEKPQVFETAMEFRGLARWNELRPRQWRPQALEESATFLFLKGVSTNLKPGDVLLLSAEGKSATAKPILGVEVDREAKVTRVDFKAEPPRVIEYRPTVPASTFPFRLPMPPSSEVWETAFGMGKAVSLEDALSAIYVSGWRREDLELHLLAPPPPNPPKPAAGVFALRQRVGFFGHNAPRQEFVAASMGKSLQASLPNPWDETATQPGTTIWENSQRQPHRDPTHVFLERVVPELVAGGWVVFEGPDGPTPGLVPFSVAGITEVGLADYAMTGRCTGLALADPQGNLLPEDPKTREPWQHFKTRTSTAYVQSERLELADLPVNQELEPGDTVLALAAPDFELRLGQILALSGERTNPAHVRGVECLEIADIWHGDRVTTLRFRRGLQFGYVRATVTLNANVVPATHGETVREVLGSGDASRAGQRFTLKQKPLTYTLPPDGSPPESSLEIWVDEVRWREVPYLYGAGPTERVYAVRQADDGTTSIQFGDGHRGALLPTGHENVRAVYRKGTGLEGQVKAGQLSLLLTQPLGVKSVTNPLPPAGAENPQAIAQARQNAPRTVLTLDRVVSLQDYEEYARDFPGVDKAHAVWTWSENLRGVLLTLLGPQGLEITESSPTAEALVVALHRLGNPHLPIRIVTARPTLFTLYGSVRTEADRSRAQVNTAVQTALRERFSYEAREFGQGVAFSEVIAVIQGVPGVNSADLNRIKKRTFGPRGVIPENFLGGYVPAHLPRDGVSLPSARPAELLLLDERTFGSPTFTIV